jgi:TRAP-type mannitol/chloroaromatic compound transport system permease small subunit
MLKDFQYIIFPNLDWVYQNTSPMQWFSRKIHQLNEAVGRITAWLTSALVLLVSFDVVQRYFFKTTSVAFLDLEWHLFAMIFLLGAGYSLRHDQHVRVDVFYTRMSERQQAWVDLLGTLFFLLPFCVVMIYASFKYAFVSWSYNEGSADPGGLPARYVIKAMISIGFSLLFLQGLAMAIDAVAKIRKPKSPTDTPSTHP